MSHIQVRRIIDSGKALWGQEWYYGCSEEQEDAMFNPDDNWQILFDVP